MALIIATTPSTFSARILASSCKNLFCSREPFARISHLDDQMPRTKRLSRQLRKLTFTLPSCYCRTATIHEYVSREQTSPVVNANVSLLLEHFCVTRPS